MQQLKCCILKCGVFISYLKFNCSSMFKINKHKFNNSIFSIILFEFRNKFRFPFSIIVEFSIKPSHAPTSETSRP
jgi:hypothetical protein